MKVLITFLLTSLAYQCMAVPAVNDDPKIDTSDMNAIKKDEKVSMHTSKGESQLTPNRPLIQLWCARSKLNMDKICSLNIHL